MWVDWAFAELVDEESCSELSSASLFSDFQQTTLTNPLLTTQLHDHGVNSDRLVGHWSQRELEELHMFSAQLLGKHRCLASNLSIQDGTLQQLETFMQHTKQKPPTEARTAALLQRLQQHLAMIKVR